MYCIGVISRDIELINELIENNKVIIMTKENINRYLEKEIDILVIEDKIIKNKNLELLCNHSKYILVQDNVNLNIKLKNEANIITFGFNHKSTVTISSISEEKVIICIQRKIKSLRNNLIEPQEMIIKNNREYDINGKIIQKIIQEILEK